MVDFKRAAKETIRKEDHGDCPLHFSAKGSKVFDPHGRIVAHCVSTQEINGVPGCSAEEIAGVIADTMTDMLHRHFAAKELAAVLKKIAENL